MTDLARPRVVLYNPRAVFYTMPLALVALASALDRDAGRRRDHRRPSRSAIRCGAVVDAADGALCVGHHACSPARRFTTRSPCRAPSRRGIRHVRSSGAAGIRRSSRDECLDEPSIDVVVIGQGEDTFREIVDRASASRCRLRGTASRGWRFGAAAAARSQRRFRAHDYSLIPVERYFALKGTRQIDYISSQGCRFRCAFCADPAVYARGWTGLAPERIADEVEHLHRRYGMDELAFQDETFFTHAPRIDALADEFLRRDLPITWTATLRADQACRMGETLFAKAVRSGLRRVMVGVESGSQEMLDRLKKDMQLEQVRETAEMCARHDVGAIFNFIVGFPGESDDSIEADARARQALRAMQSRVRDADLLLPAVSRQSDRRRRRAAQGYVFPRGLEAWADFDYVGGRGPWVSAERWRQVERFKFYTRHAWQPGAWRWPLRAAARWRCDRDWYALPGREGARRAACARRSRCRDGSAAGPRATFWPRMPKSSASCGRIRRSACCICRRI